MIVYKSPHPFLRFQAQEVEYLSESLVDLCKDMIETMWYYKGIGLAAPQIGVAQKMFIVNIFGSAEVFLNPRQISHGDKVITLEEGCLSLDKVYEVPRYTEVTIDYLDSTRQYRRRTYKGIYARVIQHEMDHLQGTLICDYVS